MPRDAAQDDTAPACSDVAPLPTVAPKSAWELFVTFTLISLQAFGGALSFIENTVVQRKRWLSAQEFLGLYGISQVLPGPSGISFCVLLGDRFMGFRGALAAVAGFVGVPAVGVLLLAALFLHYQQLAWVQGALHGMGAAAVALIIHTAARLSRGLREHHAGIAVALATFCAVGLGHLPVSIVVLTLGVGSVALAWRSVR